MYEQNARMGKKEIRLYRRLLALAGAVYFFWWFAIKLLLPNAFNPWLGRMLVVALFAAVLALSYVSEKILRRLRFLLLAGVWLITFHYAYLFYCNNGDPNWIIGAYITVIAITLCLFSNAALLSYSIYVMALSLSSLYFLPHLESTIFLPGLFTILLQANIALRSRLGIIKDLGLSNDRFQLLFHNTFDGILVHENGVILNANESISALSRFPIDELIGKNVLEIIEPNERQKVADKLSLPEVPPYETKGIGKDGRVVDVEVRSKTFTYDGRTAKLVTIQDISDRQRAEHERVAGKAMAENVRLRDEFFSIASHELKTPISALKLQTDLIRRDLQEDGGAELKDPANAKEIFSLFDRQIGRLTELVETMLDVSKMSTTQVTLKKERVDFAKLVRDVAASPAFHIEGAIEVKTPDSLFLLGDRLRLEQVVGNLLGNAVKYGKGEPIHIELKREDRRAVLSVRDHGLGIPPEFLPKIFERFERGVRARNISGLGLGLYIVKQIVDAHGGEISVESSLGRGSTFFVRLNVSN